jgi:CHAD domain-containing protein
LARRWRAVDELAAKWDDLDSTQRHSLRKHVKQLRYAIDFFAGLYAPKQIKKYLKYLEKLQTALGDLNDAVSARSLIRPLLRHSKYALTASAILGWSSCIEQNQLDAATAVLKQWQRHTPFWQ